MSSVPRRTAALLAVVVMSSIATTGVVAQDASPSPVPLPSPAPPSPFPDPSPPRDPLPSPARQGRPPSPIALTDAARCDLWEGRAAPAVGGVRFASVPGQDRYVGAVAVEPIDLAESDPSCALTRWQMDRIPGAFRDFVEDLDLDGGIAWRSDPVGDQLALTGEAFSASPDAALDITGVAVGAFDLDRRAARELIRELRRDTFTDEVVVTWPRPPEDWLERGGWQIVVLELAGDPTVPTETQRIWQLGFQAGDPTRAVAPTIPSVTPLAGVRNLLTYGQVAQDDGTMRRSVGRSDFGSRRLGPDGRTQYYNARPDAAVLEWPDGLAFVFPDAYDPIGVRPMAFHQPSGAWDLVTAPGGPMAFLPATGHAPGIFDLVAHWLEHEPISLPAIIDGAASDSAIDFPSQHRWLFGSPLFDPTQPVLVDLAYSVDGHEVSFVDLQGLPVGGGLFAATHGIPQYGRYVLTGLEVEQPGDAIPEDWDQLAEAARALGTVSWTVGAEAGPLHGSAVPHAWLTAPPSWQLHPYDPEIVDLLLREGGWTDDGP